MKCGGKYVEMTQTSQSTQNQAQKFSKTAYLLSIYQGLPNPNSESLSKLFLCVVDLIQFHFSP